MRHAIVAVIPLFLSFAPPGETRSETNVIVGDCNQVNQNITVAGESVVYIVNDCVPVDPADSFTVSYYWLNSLSTSFLMAGYVNKEMVPIFGQYPLILKNDVTTVIKEILTKFGEKPNEFTRFKITSTTVLGRKSDKLGFEDIPFFYYTRIRIYDADTTIIWPDFKAFEEFYSSPGWPSGYFSTYKSAFSSETDIASDLQSMPLSTSMKIMACVVSSRFIQRDEFIDYWRNVKEIARKIEQDKGLKYDPLETQLQELKYTHAADKSNLNTYEALRYFTKYNWPDDFLLARGEYSYDDAGCYNAYSGYILRAYPRELTVLVAVIKPKTNNLRITGINYAVDPRLGLRKDLDKTQEVKVDFELPAVDRYKSIVIPLRIELNYKENTIGEPEAKFIYDQIRALNVSEIVADVKKYFKEGADTAGEILVKKVDLFPAPEIRVLTPSYIFGPALSINHVTIKGNSYAVRPTPRYAMFTEGEFEGGSCPFVYFRDDRDEISFTGRVLVGASSRGLERTDVIPIPKHSKSIILSEKEPEITEIRKIEVSNADGSKKVELRRDLTLAPGEEIEVMLPADIEAGSRILLTGYCDTFERATRIAGKIPAKAAQENN